MSTMMGEADLFTVGYLYVTKSPQVEVAAVPRQGAVPPHPRHENSPQTRRGKTHTRQPAALSELTEANWRQFSVCSPDTVDLLFPDLREAPRVPAEVTQMCTDCPVRQRCLTEALKTRESGYWAGFTTRQRNQAIRDGLDTVEDLEQALEETTPKRRERTGVPMHPEGKASLTRYRAGCPCDACREINRREKRAENQRRREEGRTWRNAS